jgi:hypothetical protein
LQKVELAAHPLPGHLLLAVRVAQRHRVLGQPSILVVTVERGAITAPVAVGQGDRPQVPLPTERVAPQRGPQLQPVQLHRVVVPAVMVGLKVLMDRRARRMVVVVVGPVTVIPKKVVTVLVERLLSPTLDRLA